MNLLLLFFVFLLAGLISTFVFYFLFKPLKLIKAKATIFIYDFLLAFSVSFMFQLCLTLLNYGIFRAFLAISYVVGIIFASKVILQPLEKLLLMLYNNIKKKWSNKKCKEIQN